LHETKIREENLKGEVSKLSTKYSDLDKVNTELDEELEATVVELESTTKNLKELREEHKILTGKFNQSMMESESLRKLLESMERNLQVKTNAIKKLTGLSKESEHHESSLKKELAAVYTERETLRKESSDRLNEWNKTKVELEGTLERLAMSQHQEMSLQKDNEEFGKIIYELKQKIESYVIELNLTNEKLDKREKELKTVLSREKNTLEEMKNMAKLKEQVDEKLFKEKQLRVDEEILAKKNLTEKVLSMIKLAKTELEQVQTNMNKLLEEERLSGKKKVQAAEERFRKLEEKSSLDYNDLQNKMINMIESTTNNYEMKVKKLNQQFAEEIAAIKSQAENEKEKLIRKGKGLMRESKVKADEIMHRLEDDLDDANESLSRAQNKREELERKTREKVMAYKHKIQISASRIAELSQDNEQLNDNIHDLDREKSRTLEENERYRRQLGGRYGADGTTQNQMEMLQKEFNAILEENRNLKRKLRSPEAAQTLAIISETSESNHLTSKSYDFAGASYDLTSKSYPTGGVSGTALLALREEYEEQIQVLNDEKRELVMRNSAAITDVQKAEQRAWELEKELEKMKDELTSAHLAVQRVEREMEHQIEAPSVYDQLSHSSLQSLSTIQTNQENMGNFLVDFNGSTIKSHPTKQVLSPSNRTNRKMGNTFSNASEQRDSYETTKKFIESRELPTLMELTQKSNGDIPDGKPECKQS